VYVNHLVLIGDSIFDNGPYVGPGESVSEILTKCVAKNARVSLLAVDGDVTTDVPEQLKTFPDDATHAFVSCGGNDALRIVQILNDSAETVGDALESLVKVREEFRSNYTDMLESILERTSKLIVCTVYNSVPGTSERALAALALFNEVILQEAVALNLPIIDLRNICKEEGDYSQISPIEPSGQGARKISLVISRVLSEHDFRLGRSVVYT
jgi:GDSL-like Lipase/Acylhydrolase family